MRITAGELRGRSVTCPSGPQVRPTSAKVRQAFFNILGDRLRHSRFLDLFAGSGLMGFEALSRGASHVTFVDKDRSCASAIKQSARQFKLEADSYEIISADFEKALSFFSRQGTSFDIIFVDPPYKLHLGGKIVQIVQTGRLLSNRGRLIVEHLPNELLDKIEVESYPQDSKLVPIDQRRYGSTSLTIFANALTVEE